ncbi:hypothetical protein [Nonomuraea sp. NPDC050783]|uniref:hypothetical protein n=1 Tax=Nonomuraea sp. NPDC050783 TaxID=3154634 RepID=UPI003465E12C
MRIQQIPEEWAFAGPHTIAQRLGGGRAAERAASYDPEAFAGPGSLAHGGEPLERRMTLPGHGERKAQIFLALLGKQLGVQPSGWREAAGTYGEEGSHRSVADVVDAESLVRVRAAAQGAERAATAE